MFLKHVLLTTFSFVRLRLAYTLKSCSFQVCRVSKLLFLTIIKTQTKPHTHTICIEFEFQMISSHNQQPFCFQNLVMKHCYAMSKKSRWKCSLECNVCLHLDYSKSCFISSRLCQVYNLNSYNAL